MSDIVFISDLHLAAERPQIIELFLRFSEEIAAGADQLYILGDFLEYWLGDDDSTHSLDRVFEALIDLHQKHRTQLFLMHGNRDFLIGKQLAERCYFQLIDDPCKIRIQNHDALLMHGDTLCTDDIEYQNFRKLVRSPQWKQEILSKTVQERTLIAKRIRDQSKKSTSEKEETIMDVNQQETDRTFIDNEVDLLIHGHTHRPAIHHKTINGQDTTRIVLGDWYESGSYLRIKDNADFKLQTFI